MRDPARIVILLAEGDPPAREVVSKLHGAGLQPLTYTSGCQSQGFALGWYEDALSALNIFIWLQF
jgi:hypothetical protein